MTLWGKRKARQTTLLIRLHQKGPAEVFAELLWIQQQSGRKPGWVFAIATATVSMMIGSSLTPSKAARKRWSCSRILQSLIGLSREQRREYGERMS